MLNVDAHKGPCPWDTNLFIVDNKWVYMRTPVTGLDFHSLYGPNIGTQSKRKLITI